MLRQRIITALILAALFIVALFGLDPLHFAGFAALAMVIAAWEWSNLSALTGLVSRGVFVAVTAALLGAVLWYAGYFHHDVDEDLVRTVLLAGCIWWAVALLWVQGYPSSAILWGSRPARLAIGLVVLVPAWLALTYLVVEPDGEWLVILAVLTVACADIGAYFSGRAFGRHKLAPAVSPGKTLEGVAGGLTLVMVLVGIYLLLVPDQRLYAWQWAVILGVAALSSVLGDLTESMVKRHRGVKDSGVILPGHGGALDRIDSLTAALPVFALLHSLLIP
ncbi:MAG: phosphatidate cytidylyltransferase [Porticoccaceae bacterium]|nr:phosphatidate cytidylyltransferase [Porticoccaceae bacterium]